MQEIFRQYGSVVLGVVSAVLFVLVISAYFHWDSGELKTKQIEYLDAVAQMQERDYRI